MSAKHTVGPWQVSGSGIVTNDGQVAVLAGDRRVALVDAPEAEETPKKNRWRIESDERDANARLISAAPDMLAALKDLVQFFEASGFTTGFAHDARAAIAKAEGQP